MCYAAPGPRCSYHAKETLDAAQKRFKKSQSHDDFEKLKEAENEYYGTPAGIKELEDLYKKNEKDFMLGYEVNLRKRERASQLRKIGVFQDEGITYSNPAELAQHALTTPLGWEGKTPKWWKSYVKSSQENANEALATTPEILDVFDSPHGKMAVVWEPISQANNDHFPQEERGIRVSSMLFRSMETGEEIGHLKSSYMDHESFSHSFGDDEFTPFRYRAEHSGGSSYPFEKSDGTYIRSVAPEDIPETRRQVWLGVSKDMGRKYYLEETDIPDDKTVNKDLAIYKKKIQSDVDDSREAFDMPFVDYSSVEEHARGQGYGTALYIYTARRLAKDGKALRGSSIQSDSAGKVWENFKKRMPQNVGFVTLERDYRGPTDYPILDFRKPVAKKKAASKKVVASKSS